MRWLDLGNLARQHAARTSGVKTMKSFLAVLAGLAFTVAVAVVLDLVMHAIGVFGTRNQ